ncbi:stAR-related lipid transfer protein 8 isoform X2 [Trichomycterus rosablanca]|uniref:stAR-related lipid transfer protein 8 isoform X2 n=1 Tax=Trichomycterus rosablanca TaxID=2290929 RepID=UPI002F36046A
MRRMKMGLFSCLSALITRTRNLVGSCRSSRPEAEAKEACDWLRAAGFPQYVQLYEASLFPIDISSVRRDHEFLDHDSVRALCRRLMTLNKCAAMSLEVHFRCKQSEDSEEDDACALSSRWAFQRSSRTWSRLQSSASPDDGVANLRPSASSDSVLSDVTSLTSDLSLSSLSLDVTRETISPDAGTSREVTEGDEDSSSSHSVREKTKRASRVFLRRKESLRQKTREKEAVARGVSTEGRVRKAGLRADLRTTKGRTASTADTAWRSQTICRTDPSKSAALFKPQRACLYLEDYQLAWERRTNQRSSTGKEDRVVHLPSDHKPGTFPKSLSIESLCPAPSSQPSEQIGWSGEDGEFSLDGASSCLSESQDFVLPKRRNSTDSLSSVYDNVPDAFASPPDSRTPDASVKTSKDAFEHLDAILQHIHGLRDDIDQWSYSLDRQLRENESATESSAAAAAAALQDEERSDYESAGNSLNDGDGEGEMRERRDSGMGASLTRPSRKLRWHSFQNSHRPSVSSASQEINRQSAAQLNLLQKYSLLRLTAILEKHSDTGKHGWNWAVPKFMKRSKVPDYRDKRVFGVPPIVNVQRSGQPLPQSIQQAMRYLRSQCLEKVGIFRKSGVKSRIQALRQLNENSPDHVTYQGQSAYDVADLIKQYFRDLPEPLLTSKLTPTFLHIYQHVPQQERLPAVRCTVFLLPDENREVLQTLLFFLSDISSAEENQMTADTLAVCLAPSVLHLNASRRDAASHGLIGRKGGAKPDHKDLSENMAATECLSHMISECKKLFQIPQEMMLQACSSYVLADTRPLALHALGVNGRGERVDYRVYLEDNVQCLLKDTAEKNRGWHATPAPQHTELAYKKVGDGHPTRLWRVSVEMEAPPSVVLHRVLRERPLWDEDLLHSRVIESLENNTEVFHYITDSMAPHPRRDFVVLRRWSTDLPRGSCVLVSSSVDHGNVQLEAGLRAVLLTSRILIEPCGKGRSRLTHYCRADLRGRSPDWYNKVFGHLCAVEVARIRGSFPVLAARGPETKL